jgi:Uma2 family endonuclease
MNQAAVRPFYSLEDYLRNEAGADQRHEYVGGGVFAMAGGTQRHNQITGNVYVRWRQQLRGAGCRLSMVDVKLLIESSRTVYYPDVMVACDELDTHPLYAVAPCVVVEVLSPSTAGTDRREKRMAYLGLPSLNAYVLIDAETRHVEYFLRGSEGFTEARLEEGRELLLPCGERTLSLSLDDVYEDVEGLAA